MPTPKHLIIALVISTLASFCCLTTDTHAATVNAKDFGAVGDGIADDSDAIIQAINSDSDTVIISEGEYRITKRIKLTRGDKTIIGERATLFATDDDYTRPTGEYDTHTFVSIENINNITFRGIQFSARKSTSAAAPFSRLIFVMSANGVHFDSCAFTSDRELTDGSLSAMDFFSNWRNVSVTNSITRMLHSRRIDDGGGIMFRNFYNRPTGDVIFTNNTMYKLHRDEILWLSADEEATATSTNFEISGNRFFIDDDLDGSTFCIGTVSNGSYRIKNVNFHNNEVIHHGNNATITMEGVENFDLYDNDIYTNTIRLGPPVIGEDGVSRQYYTGAIFYSRDSNNNAPSTTDTIKVHDNRTLTLDSKFRVQGLATGTPPYHVYNNHHVTLNAPLINALVDHYGNFINNNVTVNGNATSVITTQAWGTQTQPKLVQDNHIQINGAANIFLHNWNANLNASATYTGNHITTTKKISNPDKNWEFAAYLVNMHDFAMNNYPLTIRDNTFIGGSDTENDTSLELHTVSNTSNNTITSRQSTTYPDFLWGIYALRDATPLSQTVTICNNTIKGFRNIRTPDRSPTINLTCN